MHMHWAHKQESRQKQKQKPPEDKEAVDRQKDASKKSRPPRTLPASRMPIQDVGSQSAKLLNIEDDTKSTSDPAKVKVEDQLVRQGLRVKSEGQSHVHGMGLKPSSEEIMEIDLLSDDDDAPGMPGQGLTQASHQQEQRQQHNQQQQHHQQESHQQ